MKRIFIVILIMSTMMTSQAQNLKKVYKEEVKSILSQIQPEEILTEKDIVHLPPIVQKYLRFAGVIGKPKVQNARIVFEGQIRQDSTKGWMKFYSEQYNTFDNPVRMFYIKARKAGIPAIGLHAYKNRTATMQIKMLGLFTIVDARGPKMDQGETVTVFNDMCFMAPATLISRNIQWEELDPLSVKAYFTNGNLRISAILYFNEEGQLINFRSDDRYETNGKEYKNYPWITPIHGYQELNGFRLPTKADAIYLRPEGEFCYGTFHLKEVEYNCQPKK